MDRAGKVKALEMLKGIFSESGAIIVTHYSGLTVAEMSDLRTKLGAEGASLKVIKNRLAKIALDGQGGEEAAGMFTGPVAIAYAPDPVSAAKVCAEYAKGNEKLVLVGGIMEGDALDKAKVEALAKMPSLDQLRGKIIGVIQAPATKVAGVLQAPAGQLARVVSAYGSKDAA
ncbi:50S ribosomal protein L10 [Hirschia maritima]|uniref:50S ribosomal protein L10 n=1 Tax=Hirschia maritima TaxID=1121961 RepID=UPI00035FA748|nr:50S ribosomal protein L10 [Hirschia maritima]